MARRKRDGAPTVSLFPFLSILACVIGTLTLMISALAIGQMDVPEFDAANEMYEIERKQRRVQNEVAKLEQEVAQRRAKASEASKQLADLERQVAELQAEHDRLANKRVEAKPPPAIEPIVKDNEQLKARLRELETERTNLKDDEKKLRAEIATRKKPPEEAVVQVKPGGTGMGLKPVFVECTKNSIVIHDKKEPIRVRRADVGKDANYVSLVKEVAQQPNTRIVFLIRDDGMGTYYDARRVATNNYARNGKLPVIGHGKLDLSQFDRS